jgi:hypothetical protein
MWVGYISPCRSCSLTARELGLASDFDEDWFRKQLTDAWNSTSAENAQMGEGPSSQAASGIGNSSSSEWVWWTNEGIWYRQTNGVDEWCAPPGGADSGWI